jgi:hypothetical protein
MSERERRFSATVKVIDNSLNLSKTTFMSLLNLHVSF